VLLKWFYFDKLIILAEIIRFGVLLTNALRAMVKESKKEIIVKFHVEKVAFYYFNKLNAQFPR
jgi:hypothetical protein